MAAEAESRWPVVTSSISYVELPWKMYVERLAPLVETDKPPMLMFPGGGQTGGYYRTTPDGRPGWADYFVGRGHVVHLTDWPGQGRCGYVPPSEVTYEYVVDAVEAVVRKIGDPRLVVFTHSMSGPMGWKLLEQAGDMVGLVVAVGPGAPGNIMEAPCRREEDPDRADRAGEIVEERDDYLHLRIRGNDLIVDLNATTTGMGEYTTKHAIGGSTRFLHEYGGVLASSRSYVPPPLMAQRVNWRGSAIRLGDDADLTGERVLIVTGSADVNHPQEVDGKTADFLAGLGADVQFMWLADLGVIGNGHVLMSEDNSDEIADLIGDRIDAWGF